MSVGVSIWLVDKNPLDLPAPPAWWQQAVHDYDAMLRIMPSQTERRYRLCRIIRRDSRLGARLQTMKLATDLQRHPDTAAMMRFGVVPELTLAPHAIFSNAIVGLLRSRDTWLHYNADPTKRVKAIESAEQEKAEREQRDLDAWIDEVNTDSFRHVKYGYRAQTQASNVFGASFLMPLPELPLRLPRALTAPPF